MIPFVVYYIYYKLAIFIFILEFKLIILLIYYEK